ncbi:MAG TPA: adenylosuccinate lyase, partial [Verrucomicrobia bacterium]|nr:adenylosuccinate lyase [Verrucomicrobiota bacterium]
AMENVALWHERDISHSSVERVIFPDSCALLDYMLHKLEGLIKGLIVYPENMKRNLGISLGMWNSQSVLLELIRKGLSRENAYELVQRSAMLTWKAKHAGKGEADFKTQLLEDPDVRKHLTKGDLDRICNLDFHLKNVKQRFRKVGIK